ncbi:hypothetical protein [Flavobacterium aestivum]|uniref:hypothetical protein n=1 Tax=Flavobacterium aestivum TaxID=3003257 RepID=UPI00228641FE|nr:hypothetical protein [Flavobacterium aestivum]
METNNIKTKHELHELVSALFTTLTPDKQKKDLYAVSFTVYDYSHLMLIISDLIRLCVRSIEDESERGSDSEESSKVNIAQILNIAIELLPIDEAEFLDKSREILLKEISNDVLENQNS